MKVKFTNLYKLISEKKKIFNKINLLIKKSSFVGGKDVKNFLPINERNKNAIKILSAATCS